MVTILESLKRNLIGKKIDICFLEEHDIRQFLELYDKPKITVIIKDVIQPYERFYVVFDFEGKERNLFLE